MLCVLFACVHFDATNLNIKEVDPGIERGEMSGGGGTETRGGGGGGVIQQCLEQCA